MSNPKITTNDYNTQMTLPPEVKEEAAVSQIRPAPKFKPYNNRQSFAILDVEGLIPEHHVARVVDEMIESIPDEQLFAHYSGGGRPPFHPKLMLKVILYGYSQKVYSCCEIEKLTRENLPAIWLAAGQKPDFRTINDFRGNRMKHLMDELFETMILRLIDDGHITLESYFLDGTKIEANANKYSFVWKKSTIGFEEKLKEKIKETLQEIREIAEAEEMELTGLSVGEATPEQLESIAVQLEKKADALTDEIETAEEVPVRKELHQRRSALKTRKGMPVKMASLCNFT
ncbi:transposase [Siminovitchia sediminis]|uniref:Transposase n=1 Tax=Siminovitchia sediminis TaxID=1274353 RepID=A0ABW4KP43_9BACI